MLPNFDRALIPKYGEHLQLSDVDDGLSCESSDDFCELKLRAKAWSSVHKYTSSGVKSEYSQNNS